jgi:hypothetical protein
MNYLINDNGEVVCMSANRTPKVKWDTLTLAQVNAEYLNKTYPKKDTTLIAYKCDQCDYYHLTTKYNEDGTTR